MPYKPKPPMAAWIQGERKRLGLSTQELADRLALIGVKVGEQTISVWESNAGRNPSPENIDALERLYASQAPLERPQSGDATAAAIDRQTLVLSELVDELRKGREAHEARLRALEAAVALQAPEGAEAPPVRSVPRR